MRKRLGRSRDELHADSLQDRFRDPNYSAIGETGARGPVRIHGEVAGLQVVPRAGAPSLEVTVDDGTGRATAIFTGRKQMGGVDPGRALSLDGMARREAGRLVLYNPAYTLLE